MTILARLVAVGVSLVIPAALAAQTTSASTPSAQPPVPHAVKVYTAKHASPSDLAKSLSRLFDGSPLRSVASSAGNSVVVSGRSTDVEQAILALEALDFRPAVVAVEILIVTSSGDAALDTKLFAGTATKVASSLEALKKDGVTVRRVVVDGVEGQAATKQTGEDRAFVVGTTATGGGRAVAQSFNRRNLGTTVEVTPRVRPDGHIALDLKIEDSRLVPPEAAEGQPMFTTDSFKGSLAVAPNQAQVVSLSDETRTKGQRTAFVVVAKVVDAATK
jgi:type II secretory pathway component GspD/PulD (secretin)